MGQIQGKDLNIYVRENGTTGSYLKLVCETSSGIDIATNTTTTVTKCASYTSTGEPTVYHDSATDLFETNKRSYMY